MLAASTSSRNSIGTMLTMEALANSTQRGNVAAARMARLSAPRPTSTSTYSPPRPAASVHLAKKITVVTARRPGAGGRGIGSPAGVRAGRRGREAELEKLGLQVIDASQEGWGISTTTCSWSNVHIQKVIRAAIDGRVA